MKAFLTHLTPRLLVIVLAGFGISTSSQCLAQQQVDAGKYQGWEQYAGGAEQIRYSSLKQINRENIDQLKVAWQYDSGEVGGMQTQPIIVDGVLYGLTPRHKTFALNAATGEHLWTFDSGVAARGANRGLMYWAEGQDRRVYNCVGQYLFALDAKTGVPVAQFGDNGRIDLRQNLDRDPQPEFTGMTTPGAVYKDMLIIGSIVGEGLPAAPGHIRAFDARTGKLRWIFHTIPYPGEPGYETWPKDAWKYTGGVNAWAGLALDERRGIVYVPLGSASADFYGANRIGDNLYANCLVAIDANTGKHIWHFQTIHHDIWDRDLPSPPNLVTIRHEGKLVDAVVQTTKQGFVFVFDRVTGQSLYPIEERNVPKSDVPGEVAALTQPFPLKPKPYARQRLTKDTLTSRTPEMQAWAEQRFSQFRSDNLFRPLTVDKDTVVFPGFDGGTEWGGSAADPETGIYYLNANDFAWLGSLAKTQTASSGRSLYLQNCATCHLDTMQGSPPEVPSLLDVATQLSHDEILGVIRDGGGRMPGFPSFSQQSVDSIIKYVTSGEDSPTTPEAVASDMAYRFTGHRKWLDPQGYPATKPPWGTLNALDLNTGEYLWQIPLGEYPELVSQGITDTGSDNYGGPIVTAGGIVFIGASSHDKKFHAFDKTTGKLLWEAKLPFSGVATPATYQVNGLQFVVIAAGGGRQRGDSGGMYVAFALPARKSP